MKKLGGVAEIEKRNNAKAHLLYSAIDRLPLFAGTAAIEDRSTMNATFVLRDAALEPAFDALWKEAGISGIRGHRSVGGYRASMYPRNTWHSLGLSQISAQISPVDPAGSVPGMARAISAQLQATANQTTTTATP